MQPIRYEIGIYRITPLGANIAFECWVQPNIENSYVLVDPQTNHSLEVTQKLLDKMRPVFIRKH